MDNTTRWRVLCTNPDSSVDVVEPQDWFIQACQHGGEVPTDYGWYCLGMSLFLQTRYPVQEPAWRAAREVPASIAIEWEIEKFVREPLWRPDTPQEERIALATRRIMAMHEGGLSEREVVELVRDCDAPSFTLARDIVDVSELPSDKTYRKAWRRSTNGGPISIDERATADIDVELMMARIEAERADEARAALKEQARRRLLV